MLHVGLNSLLGNFKVIINRKKYHINLGVLLHYSSVFRELFETGNYSGVIEIDAPTEDIELFVKFVNTGDFSPDASSLVGLRSVCRALSLEKLFEAIEESHPDATAISVVSALLDFSGKIEGGGAVDQGELQSALDSAAKHLKIVVESGKLALLEISVVAELISSVCAHLRNGFEIDRSVVVGLIEQALRGFGSTSLLLLPHFADFLSHGSKPELDRIAKCLNESCAEIFVVHNQEKSELEREARARERRISELENAVSTKGSRIAELEKSLREKDSRISEQETTIRAQRVHISEQANTLRTKDSRISGQEGLIASSKSRISELEKDLQKRDGRVLVWFLMSLPDFWSFSFLIRVPLSLF
jgi:hypothetical protein